MADDTVYEGRVKWFDEARGFGFVLIEGFQEDILVHHSEIKMAGFRTLFQGQRVRLGLIRTDSGLRGIGIVPGGSDGRVTCPKCRHEFAGEEERLKSA